MVPAELATSELLREAASWLTVFAYGSGNPRLTREEISALTLELRVRARWIETARADQGVSDDRRRGIAAIDDADTSGAVGRAL